MPDLVTAKWTSGVGLMTGQEGIACPLDFHYAKCAAPPPGRARLSVKRPPP